MREEFWGVWIGIGEQGKKNMKLVLKKEILLSIDRFILKTAQFYLSKRINRNSLSKYLIIHRYLLERIPYT